MGESGFTQGHVLSAAGKKKWLIIDEIDRAKLDKAFGDLSSFLGGLPLSLPDGSREIAAPKDWRIVATRDSGAGAPEASAALLRRFAEIRLPRPDAADLDAAIDAATEGDPTAAAVVKRLAADEDLAELGAGPFLDAARHAAERNALSPASEEELEQEIRTAYIEPAASEVTSRSPPASPRPRSGCRCSPATGRTAASRSGGAASATRGRARGRSGRRRPRAAAASSRISAGHSV